ncbi:MAG: DNA-directed polymerase [Massilibacillus sp.]|nr:DNA-directed polymerase [Massilibacillus sp.]
MRIIVIKLSLMELMTDYSDKIEPYGIDEAWLDVTGTDQLFGTGQDIANQIRQRLQDELGLTGSVGVS